MKRRNHRMKEKILKILLELDDEIANVGEEDNLIEAGFIDSFAVVSLVDDLETEFSIVMEPEEIIEANFSSIASICALVESKLKV